MIRAEIKKEFNCDVETLWSIITDNSNYAWRSDLSKIEIIDETHFVEYDKKDFATNFTITAKEKLKEYKFDIDNKNIKGKWTGLFNKLENGNTEITFIEEIEVNNFIMKLLAKPYLRSQQKQYIADLEKKLSDTKNNN